MEFMSAFAVQKLVGLAENENMSGKQYLLFSNLMHNLDESNEHFKI